MFERVPGFENDFDGKQGQEVLGGGFDCEFICLVPQPHFLKQLYVSAGIADIEDSSSTFTVWLEPSGQLTARH